MGNPGVFQRNPHLYPWIPAPMHKGMGFGRCGLGLAKTHGHKTCMAGYVKNGGTNNNDSVK